jgi:Ser/Thr protein kinase RdoA (MazF antagonist)
VNSDAGHRPELANIARMALPAWGLADEASLKLLKYRENAVFSVSMNGSPAYVLRVHRRGYHTDSALRSELAWMTALNSQGIPTPRVAATKGGDVLTHVAGSNGEDPHQCDLLSWVPGVPLGSIENRSFGKEDFIARAYHQVGRLAAQLHSHSERWRPARPVDRHSWDEEGCLGPRAVWGYYADLNTLTDVQRTLLRSAVDVARRRLADYGKASTRFGLIHGDLIPENVLIDGESCTVIDFDDAGFGWYVAEIATAVFFQVGTASFAPALRAMIGGYRQIREISSADLRMLDVMLFLRGLAVFGWIRTRGETDTAKQINASVIEITMALAAHLTADLTYPTRLKVNFETLIT